MTNREQRQALAVGARHSSLIASGFPGGTVLALEQEAARIVAEDDTKRANGGTSGHIVVSDGILSGFVKDAHTTVRFAGGTVAVTTHY